MQGRSPGAKIWDLVADTVASRREVRSGNGSGSTARLSPDGIGYGFVGRITPFVLPSTHIVRSQPLTAAVPATKAKPGAKIWDVADGHSSYGGAESAHGDGSGSRNQAASAGFGSVGPRNPKYYTLYLHRLAATAAKGICQDLEDGCSNAAAGTVTGSVAGERHRSIRPKEVRHRSSICNGW